MVEIWHEDWSAVGHDEATRQLIQKINFAYTTSIDFARDLLGIGELAARHKRDVGIYTDDEYRKVYYGTTCKTYEHLCREAKKQRQKQLEELGVKFSITKEETK